MIPAVDIEALQARIVANERVWRATVAKVVQRLSEVEAAFTHSQDVSLSAAAVSAEHRRSTAEAAFADARAKIDAEVASHSAAARSIAADRIALLAPGAASLAWDAAQWSGLEASPGPADYIRVGTIAVQGGSVPAVLRLAPGDGWLIHGDEPSGRRLLFQTALRVVAQSPLPHLVIETFDPRASAELAPLAPLRTLHGASFPSPTADADTFVRRLEDVIARASLTAERVVSAGARSLGELWQARATPEGTLTLVVVLGYPYGVTARMQQLLRRLADLGPTAGVILIVQETADAQPAEREVRAADLRSPLRAVRVDAGEVFTDVLPAARLDPEPQRDRIAAVFDAIKARMSGDKGASIPLAELIRADLDRPWTRSSVDGLEATIGRAGDLPVGVSFRTANPPHPNLLAGGMVGSGKSTLLLDVIYSLALRYSPDELDLLLLDFKQGVEFNVFAPDADGENGLPHASVLGLETDPEFGLAVLRHVAGELERRADLFKAAAVSNFVDYRGSGAPLARTLVVIDEFHELFNGDEEQAHQAVRLLETIARQGRSAGVHLLLASQTISGIQALGTKGDAIFSQFPLRLSLKNTPVESQSILAPQNKAAAELRYRGEFILNRDGGNEKANEHGVAAFAEAALFRAAQSRMAQARPGLRARIFYARRSADWEPTELPGGPAADAVDLWIGRPIDVAGDPVRIRLTREVDQCVAILGADFTRGPVIPDVVAGMIVSGAHQLRAQDEIVVLTGHARWMPEWLEAPFAHASALGVRSRHVPAGEAAAYLRDEVATRTREAPGRLLLFVLQVPQMPDLHAVTDPAPVTPAAADDPMSLVFRMENVRAELRGPSDARSAAAVLSETARDGALRGIHLVASWPNLQTLSDLLGIAHRGVGAYITAGLGLDDLRTVASAHRVRIDGQPRIGLMSRSGSGGLQTLIPFEAWSADHETRWRANR